jgi:uncharacterized protein (TIGR00730 family)
MSHSGSVVSFRVEVLLPVYRWCCAHAKTSLAGARRGADGFLRKRDACVRIVSMEQMSTKRATGERRQRVCVFCGSRDGARAEYRDTAQTLGREIAGAGFGLVYGGAQVGLMGEVADAAIASGGEVIGVLPKKLASREIAHENLTRLYVVETMHERKAKMAEESDAFVALPGGYGTLDEFFEVVTWSMLGIHQKPCLMVNTSGYYDPLIAFLKRAREEQFVSKDGELIIQIANEAKEVVPLLAQSWRRLGSATPDREDVPQP